MTRRTRAAGLVFAVFCLAVSVQTRVGHAQAPTAATDAEVQFFRSNIEPLLMRGRGGTEPGYAACVMCHTWQTSLRFMLVRPDSPAGWSPAQSRQNFDMLTKLVDTSNPESSRLLLKPLAVTAGGLGHTGGEYWKSKDEAEYQTVLKWIQSFPANRFVPAPQPPLDFTFFRSCVQKVFQNPKEGQIRCSNCHGGGQMGFAPVPGGGRPEWNDDEAKRAFAVINRLVIPGNPIQSRFLLKPLHPDGGGSYAHNGVRRWQTRDDPEWQALAAWVRGERTGNNCS